MVVVDSKFLTFFISESASVVFVYLLRICRGCHLIYMSDIHQYFAYHGQKKYVIVVTTIFIAINESSPSIITIVIVIIIIIIIVIIIIIITKN